MKDKKLPRKKVQTTLTIPSYERLKKAALERDVPISVLIRDMMNHAVRNGFNL